MQTLQKLHLSNMLYIEQVTCHLMMLLLSSRACSETAKRNYIYIYAQYLLRAPLDQVLLKGGRLVENYLKNVVAYLKLLSSYRREDKNTFFIF